nr:hypothetical protein [Sulfitobacter brevis]
MAKLTAVSHIIRAEQDADIAVEFGFSTPSGTTWSAGDTVDRWIPPQVFTLTFLGINLAINGFLADPEWSTLVDHAVTDLLGCPTILDALNHELVQLRLFDRLALAGTTIRLHHMGRGTAIAIASGHAFVLEMVAP